MSLYSASNNGQTFPLFGLQAGAMTASNSPSAGNGNASPAQVDLVAGAATNPAAHAQAAVAAGIGTVAAGAFAHPLLWAVVAVQLGFIALAFLAHMESRAGS